MKTKLIIVASATVASFMSLFALAQVSPSVRVIQPAHPFESAASAKKMDRLSAATKASDLLGMEVHNLGGEKLGKVEDFAVDVESGRIVQVILASGGFFGFGETLHAVPPAVMQYAVAQKVIHLDADQQKYAAAPTFDMSKWSECSDSDHLAKTYKHYGVPIWFSESDAKGTQGVEKRDRVAGVKREGVWDETSPSAFSGANHSLAKIGHVQKASKILGRGIINQYDDKLGNVENLMLDLPAGRIVAVIVSSGKFIGISDQLSAVPSSALKYDAEGDTLRLDVSKEVLSAAPHFKASEWPDLGEAAYVGRVYSAHNIEPYFNAETRDGADGSASTEDQNNESLTPVIQGTNQNDLDTTTRIRREVVGTKSLSVNAQNVKIVTAEGRVTLRGNVDSPEEKRLIGQIATNAARPNAVDNQLQVK